MAEVKTAWLTDPENHARLILGHKLAMTNVTAGSAAYACTRFRASILPLFLSVVTLVMIVITIHPKWTHVNNAAGKCWAHRDNGRDTDSNKDHYREELLQLLTNVQTKNSLKLEKTAEKFKFSSNSVGIWANHDNKKLLCQLKRLFPRAISKSTPPFDANPMKHSFPDSSDIYLHNEPPALLKGSAATAPGTRDKCALVSSSGRMRGSRLGLIIDSFDEVLRINSAPVRAHESDVGSRTTIRMLNNFEMSRMTSKNSSTDLPDTKNATIIGWDACYGLKSFHTCLKNCTDKSIRKSGGLDSLQPFFEWKKKNPTREIHFLDPDWMKDLAYFIQYITPVRLRRIIPSSGFIGTIFLMHYCSEVHLFEMIPSWRRAVVPAGKCHYFDHYLGMTDVNLNCTLMQGHQRETEILTLLRFNLASDEEVFQRGRAILPGFVGLDCSDAGADINAARTLIIVTNEPVLLFLFCFLESLLVLLEFC